MSLYRSEVLERRVSLQYFQRERKSGRIRQVKMYVVDGKILCDHFVEFDNGESDWIDLDDFDSFGQLRWIDNDYEPETVSVASDSLSSVYSTTSSLRGILETRNTIPSEIEILGESVQQNPGVALSHAPLLILPDIASSSTSNYSAMPGHSVQEIVSSEAEVHYESAPNTKPSVTNVEDEAISEVTSSERGAPDYPRLELAFSERDLMDEAPQRPEETPSLPTSHPDVNKQSSRSKDRKMTVSVECMPKSIDSIIHLMDHMEPNKHYFLQQQDYRRGCSRTRRKLRRFARANPTHPAIRHWVETQKWKPPDNYTLQALMRLIKRLIK